MSTDLSVTNAETNANRATLANLANLDDLASDLARLDRRNDTTLATITDLRVEVAKLSGAVDTLTREIRRMGRAAPLARPVVTTTPGLGFVWLPVFVGLACMTALAVLAITLGTS